MRKNLIDSDEEVAYRRLRGEAKRLSFKCIHKKPRLECGICFDIEMIYARDHRRRREAGNTADLSLSELRHRKARP